MIVYFDMDGVLCNFDARCDEFNAWREDIHKCNWTLLDKIGPKFWSEMTPISKGMDLLHIVQSLSKSFNFNVGILSAVHLLNGKIGKKQWLKQNTTISPEFIKIINNSHQKYKLATPDSILIDDKQENVEAFIKAGGKALLFDNSRYVEDLYKDLHYIMKELNYDYK